MSSGGSGLRGSGLGCGGEYTEGLGWVGGFRSKGMLALCLAASSSSCVGKSTCRPTPFATSQPPAELRSSLNHCFANFVTTSWLAWVTNTARGNLL